MRVTGVSGVSDRQSAGRPVSPPGMRPGFGSAGRANPCTSGASLAPRRSNVALWHHPFRARSPCLSGRPCGANAALAAAAVESHASNRHFGSPGTCADTANRRPKRFPLSHLPERRMRGVEM
jgi:hypothetical protein